MRPNHQNNKRMRGRNRGGKGPNPLSRTYESNGPDVKIRGTAQHIAEKYLQLARDAQASGDPVSGESYLQHAEHYLRIIAAAQEQFRQQNPNYRFDTPGQDEGDEDGDEMQGFPTGGPQPDARFPVDQDSDFQPRQQQPRQDYQARQDYQQQPREPREPREWQPREQRDSRGEWQPREGQQPREPREPREWQPREQRENRGDWQPREGQQRRDDRFQRRGPRPEFRQDPGSEAQPGLQEPRGGAEPRQEQPRQEQPRAEQPRAEQPRTERPPRGERPPRFERAPAAEEPATGLPAFITAPVRTPVAEEPVEVAPAPAAAAEGDEAGRFPLRQRRRRTPRARTEDGSEAPATGDVPVGE